MEAPSTLYDRAEQTLEDLGQWPDFEPDYLEDFEDEGLEAPAEDDDPESYGERLRVGFLWMDGQWVDPAE